MPPRARCYIYYASDCIFSPFVNKSPPPLELLLCGTTNQESSGGHIIFYESTVHLKDIQSEYTLQHFTPMIVLYIWMWVSLIFYSACWCNIFHPQGKNSQIMFQNWWNHEFLSVALLNPLAQKKEVFKWHWLQRVKWLPWTWKTIWCDRLSPGWTSYTDCESCWTSQINEILNIKTKGVLFQRCRFTSLLTCTVQDWLSVPSEVRMASHKSRAGNNICRYRALTEGTKSSSTSKLQ